ncbi:MAG TPA: hypothetical protein VF188_11460 [Longimicrobiales bacterium]
MKTTRAILILAASALAVPTLASAQQDAAEARARSAEATARSATPEPERVHVVTRHTATIGGKQIEYDATVGNIILENDDGEPIASVFYTAYTKRGVADPSTRPITFAYNGGPGSASVWVHMGAFGPRRVPTPDAAHAPPPPYDLVDNEYSPLDRTDLVFIDPVGTGFSRAIGKGEGKDFWGVDQDARSLAQFVRRYLSENNRWNSPRYLMGESYGTTRSAALVNVLQSRNNMDFNGVVLVSSVLDFQTISFNPGNLMPYILYLPSYTAVAWYHHALPEQPAELEPLLAEVEHFAVTDYAQALLAGAALDPAVRERILDQLHRYTGLSKDYLDKADLRVDASQFEKELMREHGLVIGRLDARFTGPTGDLLGERAPYDPQSAAVSSAYTSAFNTYLHNELNFPPDRQYTISGNVRPWDWSHGNSRGWPGYTNVAVDLAQALELNTHLEVLLVSGIYDLATPYFAAEWTMDQLGVPEEIRARVHEARYEAGHMMYLHEASLAKLKRDIAAFIDRTSGRARQPVAVAR